MAALLLGSALLFGVRLGVLDLWAPDEPRYGAIAEEMRSGRHGAAGWLLLHANGAPYTQKPPLYFWLAAGLGSFGGRVDEAAARWPSAAAGIVTVALTAIVARRLLGRATLAWWAAAFLATAFRFAYSARRAQLDVLLTGFELVAMALFVSHEFPDARRSTRPGPGRVAALHAALGAAALVKGPVGWLPLLVIGAFLVFDGRGRAFRAWIPIWAWGLSVGPVTAWISAAVWLAPPGFADVAVTENLIGRFFAGTAHVRPPWYYLLQAPLDFLPWSLLWPWGLAALWRAWRVGPERRGERLLALWIAIPFAFFTLSAGKRGVYLLPIFPALAMMSALAIEGLRASRGSRTGEVEATPGSQALPASGAGVPRGLVVALAIVFALEFGLFQLALPRLDPAKSPRPIARAIAAEARPGEATAVYGLEPIEAALGYYGAGPITSLGLRRELRAFLREHGGMVLLRARHFDELAPGLGLEARRRFRAGRRELVLAIESPREPAFQAPAGGARSAATSP